MNQKRAPGPSAALAAALVGEGGDALGWRAEEAEGEGVVVGVGSWTRGASAQQSGANRAT